MSQITTWTEVQIAMESAAAAAVTITAISKASQGVVTAANTLTAGDWVRLTVSGMRELDNMLARVGAATAPSFTLEGIDTTNFDTFTTGSFEKITLGTSMSTVSDVKSSGGDFSTIDITTIHDGRKKEIGGIASAYKFDLEHNWDPADAAQIALRAASATQAKKSFLFTFKNGSKTGFTATIDQAGNPSGKSGAAVTTGTTLRVSGDITNYAT